MNRSSLAIFISIFSFSFVLYFEDGAYMGVILCFWGLRGALRCVCIGCAMHIIWGCYLLFA